VGGGGGRGGGGGGGGGWVGLGGLGSAEGAGCSGGARHTAYESLVWRWTQFTELDKIEHRRWSEGQSLGRKRLTPPD